MSIVAGVDIGSTASKAVILVDGKSVGEVVGPSSTNPKRTAHEIYEKALATANVDASDVELVVGTGYGRAQVEFAERAWISVQKGPPGNSRSIAALSGGGCARGRGPYPRGKTRSRNDWICARGRQL